LRFGQALRLLGEINAAALRDLMEELESVQTLDRLLLVLAHAAQDCQVATARSPFIVVPTEEDLKYLLEDLEQVGVQTIARFLITLSALRYPRLDESELDAQRLSPSACLSDRSASPVCAGKRYPGLCGSRNGECA